MIKKVSPEEKKWFFDALYPLQDKILALIKSDKFYLTGGTCLSRFYYHHRLSEDLDFFFIGDKYDLADFEIEFAGIAKRLKSNFEMSVNVNEKSFKRAFLEKENLTLKLEFIFEPFPVIGKRKKIKSFLIDTTENIAVNKITAVYSRKTVKDYFDLYFLLKEFSLEELIKKSELKMIPPAFEDLIISTENVLFEGEVLSMANVTEKEFSDFAKKLINDILEYAKGDK